MAFTILMTSAIVGNFLFHFLASCPPMLHDTLDTRNIWCDLLYERNNAISNADHCPCTAYGLSFALQPRHTAPDLDGGGPGAQARWEAPCADIQS